MAKKLYDWFGVTITEYPSAGQELDVFSINSNGIKLMIETIWTDSRLNFFRDMVLLIRSDAHIKIAIAQSTVVQNGEFVREFRKTQISELKRGTVVPEMLDGNKILEDMDYRENYVKGIIMESLKRFKEQNTISNTFNVSVLPTETSEHLGDTSLEKLKLYLNSINPKSTQKVRLTAWKDLERVAITKRIWKIPEVWDKLTDEILSNRFNLSLNGALSVLKRILITSRSDSDSKRDVTSRARLLYKNKLEEILASTEETSEQYKSDSKQILEFLTNNDERFQIYWNAWKKCMKEIKESNQYTHFIGYFINDLINATNENKESIQEELYALIGSEDENISSRAKGLHDVMFS